MKKIPATYVMFRSATITLTVLVLLLFGLGLAGAGPFGQLSRVAAESSYWLRDAMGAPSP